MIISVSNVNFPFTPKSVFPKISEYNAFENDVLSHFMIKKQNIFIARKIQRKKYPEPDRFVSRGYKGIYV